MGFIAALVVGLVLMIVGEIIRPKQNPQNATASSLDDFDVPTAEEGRAIPIFYGMVKITGSNVVWFGDLESVAIKKKVKTGLFSSKKQTTGYKYFMGMQLAMSHGRDDITLVKVTIDGDEPDHTTVVQADGSLLLNFTNEDFFGGKDSGGGFTGKMTFYKGNVGQQPNAYMARQTGEEIFPAYEGLCHAVMEHMYIGTSNYIKDIAWILSSYPNQLGIPDGKHKIGDDINPMCMIYEMCTDLVWGCALPSGNINVAGWRTVGLKLWDEKAGMSSIYNGGAKATDMISDILRHIDGVIYTDPSTGLLEIALARADYDVTTLPIYDESVFLNGIQFSRPSWSETKNHIKGTWVNRDEDFAEQTLSMADLANVTQRGGEQVIETVDYSGFNTYEPAARAVARTLKTLSYPLAKVSGTINTTISGGGRPKPNGVFKLKWDSMGINEVVFRITGITYNPIEANTYDIEAVEDIFAINNVGYVDPGPSEWVKPSGPPTNLLYGRLMEAPYFFTGNDTADVITLGARIGSMDFGYQTWLSNDNTNYTAGATVTDWTAIGTLVEPYNYTGNATDDGFNVGPNIDGYSQIDTDLSSDDRTSGRTMALLVSDTTEELVMYGTANVLTGKFGAAWRGVLDTVPQNHPVGTRVYFLESGFGFGNSDPYTAAQIVYAKLRPYNGRGLLALNLATTVQVQLRMRAAAPLPPGNIRVDSNNAYSAVRNVNGVQFTVQWNQRTREDMTIIKQDASARRMSPNESSFLKYKLRFTVVATGQVLIESGEIWGLATQAYITLAYEGLVKVELWATMSGINSYQKHTFNINVTNAGTANKIVGDDPVYVIDAGEVKP